MADELAQLREENARLRAKVSSLELLVGNSLKEEKHAENGGDGGLAGAPTPCVLDHELSTQQIERYSRQLILKSFGLEAQVLLCSSSVLVVGAGGLGSTIALYLAAAGIGRLGIVDKDTVEVSNLHRQIIHREAFVDIQKAESARAACLERNSSIKVEVHNDGLWPSTALDIIEKYDVVVDATDNAPSRYLISDACVVANKPLVSGAAIGTDGQMTVYNYEDDGPCYRCLFPECPVPAACSTCSDAGVLGPVPGAIGVLQSLEAIKIITKVGIVMSKKLLMVDFLSSRFHNVKLRGKASSCVACGENPTITKDSIGTYDYSAFTGQRFDDGPGACVSIFSPEDRLSPGKASEKLAEANGSALVIDVRPEAEFRLGHLQGSINAPLQEWNSELPKLLSMCGVEEANEPRSDGAPPASVVLVVCRRGNDSQIAVERLRKAGVVQAKDIVGGLTAWAEQVDPRMPKY